MSKNLSRYLLSLSSWKIMVLFMVSSPTGAWLGAGRATSASMCAAASVAHQLGQADEPKAANSLERGQENP